MATSFEDGDVGGIEVTDSGGGGGGSMAWEMPSRAAKRQGSYGLRLDVRRKFEPAWKAKIALGSFWAVGGFTQVRRIHHIGRIPHIYHIHHHRAHPHPAH